MNKIKNRKAIQKLVKDAGYTSINDYAKSNTTPTGKTMSSAGVRYNADNGCKDIDALQNYAATLDVGMQQVMELFTSYSFTSHLKDLGFEQRSDKGDKVQQYIANIKGVAITVFINGNEAAFSSSIQDESIGKGGRDYNLPFVPYFKQMTVDIINSLSTPVIND